MKKKLEAELVSIAHRILKLKGKEDVIKMHAEVSVLFEKLSVLKFLNEDTEENVPTAGINSSFLDTLESAFNNKKDAAHEAENKSYINLGDVEEEENMMVPGIETIKEMVAHMPDEVEHIDEVLKDIPTKKESSLKNDLEDLMASFKTMPVFEPVIKAQNGVLNEKKSLNDTIKIGALNIGLNDKLAFIKHLFDGESEDYERVMAQLKSFESFESAKQFIVEIVKLDYNNWVGKEEVEARFLQIIESKYN
ncbi:hypothetical protein ACFQ1R_10100 [Mariniflexile jejuense]|uniref:Uncharacterized protein n=1 Tax=Mariniflexile jejuense TaxID=1173582 RepID=A0ABW3JJ22_9FLAO